MGRINQLLNRLESIGRSLEKTGQAHNLMLEPAWQQVADTIDSWITHEVKLP